MKLILELIQAYYNLPQGSGGGSLHIVLDDGNTEDHHISFCQGYAEDENDREGWILAELLLRVEQDYLDTLIDKWWKMEANLDLEFYEVLTRLEKCIFIRREWLDKSIDLF